MTGRRSAASLPVKLWSLAVGEMDKRPFFRAGYQLLPDGIPQDVIRLFVAAFVMSQPRFKKIALPNQAEFFGRPFLPFTDDSLQRFSRRWEGKQRMQMVRMSRNRCGHHNDLSWR
jgi:hypothetical protein